MFQGTSEVFCNEWHGPGNQSQGPADTCSFKQNQGSGWINYYSVLLHDDDHDVRYTALMTFGKCQDIKPL